MKNYFQWLAAKKLTIQLCTLIYLKELYLTSWGSRQGSYLVQTWTQPKKNKIKPKTFHYMSFFIKSLA